MSAGKAPSSSLGCSQETKDHHRALSSTSKVEALYGFLFGSSSRLRSTIWSFGGC